MEPPLTNHSKATSPSHACINAQAPTFLPITICACSRSFKFGEKWFCTELLLYASMIGAQRNRALEKTRAGQTAKQKQGTFTNAPIPLRQKIKNRLRANNNQHTTRHNRFLNRPQNSKSKDIIQRQTVN